MSDLKDRQQAKQNVEGILDSLRTELNKKPYETLRALSDHTKIAQRLAALVPDTAQAYGKLVGPVYSTRALETMWSISRQAISKKVANHSIIGLKVDGSMLYPVFQFEGAKIRNDVQQVAQILLPSADSFTVAQWFKTTCTQDSKERTFLQMLDDGELETVRRCALQTAERWSA